jgi:hypothetical protein
MHVVFRRDRDVSSKNPGSGVDLERAARKARRQGVLDQPSAVEKLFFAPGFFAQAKKGGSRPFRGTKVFAFDVAVLLHTRSRNQTQSQSFHSRSGSELL